MTESKEILTMRSIVWERAKGELNAYMQTFWPEYEMDGSKRSNGFDEAQARISKFIRDFEDNCR